jgi:hypothetical protein
MKVNLATLAKYRLFLFSLVLLLTSLAGQAQQNSTITGTVLDKNGALVPGAEVTLTQQQTGFVSKAISNDSGNFTFNGLNVGTYDLKATAKGFDAYVEKGIVVNVSQTTRVDATLTVGSVDQTVTVQSDVLTVQTDSNVVSTLVSEEQITEIATENRNFASLVALGLGVSSTLPDNNTPTSVGASSNISVNGLRQSHNIWLIDGGEADDRGGAGGISILPSQDAIAQMETLTSNYPPDYGISSGATISLSLKSGTQSFHGEAWEFNRNTAFNANSFQNKNTSGTPTPRAKLNYNIFGVNAGGPLFIPGFYNKDRKKTFFFWNEEWRKLIQGNPPNLQNDLPAADFPTAGQNLAYVSPKFAKTPVVLTVPTVGDPAWAAKLAANCPTCVQGQPFPGGVIPAGLFDANAVAYLGSGIVPKPNTANDQFLGQASLPINVRDDVVRVDHRVNDKYQILAHYLHDSVSQAFPAPMVGWSTGSWPTITSTLNNPSNSGAVKLTATISPTLLVEASMNYDGNIIDIVNSPSGNLPSGFSVNKFFSNGAKAAPSMQWNGVYGGVQENPGSAPWHNAAQDLEPKVDVSYTMGKHAMKFGASYNRYTKNQKLFLNAEGSYAFSGATGDSFMDMLLGLSSSYSESQAAPIRHYVNQTPSVYAMDTWKVTPRLSLQLGLRYDALPQAWERNNQVATFDPSLYLSVQSPTWLASGSQLSTGPGFQVVNGTPFYLNGVRLAGKNGTPRALVRNDYNSLQPRVGFSEDLFGNGKTVLRGGFGTFYERMQGNVIYNAATAAPFANTPSASNVYLSDPHTSYVSGLAAATPFFAQGSESISQNFPPPAVAQFSLGVQNQLAPSVILVVQYVGNLAWHQNEDRNINNYSLNTPLGPCPPSCGNNQSFDVTGGPVNDYLKYTRANAGDPNNHSGTNPGGTNIPIPDQMRVYDGFGGILDQENNSNGNYNGFQTGLRIQNRWGLSGEVDYTYSHEVDITSQDDATVANPYNLKYDKGSGIFDRRHILSMNYIYKLPIFKASGLTHSVLGGWELAGTIIDETGVPTIPAMSLNYDTIGLGGGYTNRPNASGKVKKLGGVKNAFDTSVFSFPTPAWAGGPNQGFGSSGRDAIPGPNRVNFTTSLYKSFAITERARFEFRAESFNTFNHAEPNGVGNSLGNSNFGTVTSFYDPRAMEFGGKFIF